MPEDIIVLKAIQVDTPEGGKPRSAPGSDNRRQGDKCSFLKGFLERPEELLRKHETLTLKIAPRRSSHAVQDMNT